MITIVAAITSSPSYKQRASRFLLQQSNGVHTFLLTMTKKLVVRLPSRSWSQNLVKRWCNSFQYGSLSGTPFASLKSAFWCFSKVAKTCASRKSESGKQTSDQGPSPRCLLLCTCPHQSIDGIVWLADCLSHDHDQPGVKLLSKLLHTSQHYVTLTNMQVQGTREVCS